MPIYNEGGPAAYAQTQQSRQDDQFRQLLQMMMMGIQQKTQQGQYSDKMRQQALENQRKEIELGLERRRTESGELGALARMETARRPLKETQWEGRQKKAAEMVKSKFITQEEADIYLLTDKLPRDKNLTAFQDYTVDRNKRKDRQGSISGHLSRLGRKLSKMENPKSITEIAMGLASGASLQDIGSGLNVDTEEVKRLQGISSELELLISTLDERDLTKEESKHLNSLLISVNRGAAPPPKLKHVPFNQPMTYKEGAMPGGAATQPPPSQVPPEVTEYMKKHPEVPLEEVMAMYVEYMKLKK